jgi:hypothetical protein
MTSVMRARVAGVVFSGRASREKKPCAAISPTMDTMKDVSPVPYSPPRPWRALLSDDPRQDRALASDAQEPYQRKLKVLRHAEQTATLHYLLCALSASSTCRYCGVTNKR